MAGNSVDIDPDYQSLLRRYTAHCFTAVADVDESAPIELAGNDIIWLEDEPVYEEEKEDEDEEKDEEEEDTGRMTLRRVLYGDRGYVRAINAENLDNSVVESGDVATRRSSKGGGKASRDVDKDEGGEEWNRSEIDGLFCPICMEAWTNESDHQIW